MEDRVLAGLGVKHTGFGLHELRTHTSHDSPETATGTAGFPLWPPKIAPNFTIERSGHTGSLFRVQRVSSFHGFLGQRARRKSTGTTGNRHWNRRSSALCTAQRVAGFGSRLSLSISRSRSTLSQSCLKKGKREMGRGCCDVRENREEKERKRKKREKERGSDVRERREERKKRRKEKKKKKEKEEDRGHVASC
jgi:hypothetical protein